MSDLLRDVLIVDGVCTECRDGAPCGFHVARKGNEMETLAKVLGVGSIAADDFAELVVEGSALIRDCAKGYGEPVPYFAAHDACKRLYRMGWRKVAPPELSTCRRCGAENVVTAQSVCIDCVGKSTTSRPGAGADASSREPSAND